MNPINSSRLHSLQQVEPSLPCCRVIMLASPDRALVSSLYRPRFQFWPLARFLALFVGFAG